MESALRLMHVGLRRCHFTWAFMQQQKRDWRDVHVMANHDCSVSFRDIHDQAILHIITLITVNVRQQLEHRFVLLDKLLVVINLQPTSYLIKEDKA